MAVQRQKYNTTGGTTYNKSAFVDVVPKCNGFTFTNTGDTIVTVNGMICHPGVPGTSLGDSRSVGGNENEEYAGNIKISFAFPAGANPAVEIIQKFFVD